MGSVCVAVLVCSSSVCVGVVCLSTCLCVRWRLCSSSSLRRCSSRCSRFRFCLSRCLSR